MTSTMMYTITDVSCLCESLPSYVNLENFKVATTSTHNNKDAAASDIRKPVHYVAADIGELSEEDSSKLPLSVLFYCKGKQKRKIISEEVSKQTHSKLVVG